MNSKVWKKEDIKDLMNRNDAAVLIGMIRIYQLQTDEEKFSKDTYYNNNVGFSGFDGKIMTSIAGNFLQYGTLSERQYEIVKKKMLRYAGQLAKIANGEIALPNKIDVKIKPNWLKKGKKNVQN